MTDIVVLTEDIATIAVSEDVSTVVETVEVTEFIESADSSVAISTEERTEVLTSIEAEVVVSTTEVSEVVTEGEQGPPGPPGLSAAGAVFILDVTATGSGIVGEKTFEPDTIPANVELAGCLSDTRYVRVHVGCEGGGDSYSPVVTVNGVAALLTESSTKRWFTGYADIALAAGQNTVIAASDAGSTDETTVEVLGAGPDILSIEFGPYPGTQTELKSRDQIQVTITTQPNATSVTVLSQGAVVGSVLPVTAGAVTGTLAISNASGLQVVTARAKNSFGTFGSDFASPALTLNQTHPSVGPFVVSYPVGQQAINTGETALVTAAVADADAVQYTSAHLTIPNPTIYENAKSVIPSYSGYEGSGVNYEIMARRSANDSTTTGSTLVRIATVPSTAYIVAAPAGRMASSPLGIDYEVRIYPDQLISTPPSLTASHGAWQGNWTNAGSYWKRTLRIADSVARGIGTFSGLSLVGPSGIVGGLITSGSTYVVGGFSQRTVTFPAFSRVVALGVAVADQTKTSAQLSGGAVLTRHMDNGVYANGYYIANADGDYDPNGGYLGLSDSVFAGSNTSGTLQAIVQEAA